MGRPAVSVCVPARNHAAFIAEAVAGALREDVDLEVLVGDDASCDGTGAAAAAAGDARVRVLRSDLPSGVAATRDRLRAAARGHYLAWLDADDVYEPGGLARQVARLDAEPRVGLVHGRAGLIDAAGRPLPDWPAPFGADATEAGGVAFGHLVAGNEIITSTVVVRRAVERTVGSTPRLASSSDWALWLRLALRADVAYTAAPVARYRRHAATISHATAAGARLRCDRDVLEDVFVRPGAPLRDTARARAAGQAALCARAVRTAADLLAAGRRRTAVTVLALARQAAPAPVRPAALELAARTAAGDALGAHRAGRAVLRGLLGPLEGTRAGTRLAAAVAGEEAWAAGMERAAEAVRAAVPPRGHVGVIAKWDPTVLALSGRRGRNVPDGRLLGPGYPADGPAAVAHLDALRADGVTHLAVPRPSFWWLEHYPELADELRERHRCLHDADDCRIYALEPGR